VGTVHGDAMHPSHRSMDLRSRFNETKGYAIFKSPPSNRDRWLGSSGGARRCLAQHARWLQGRLARVEPTARSGGSLTMRSTPTRSMEDRGSHHGLRGRHRGQAWAGDEEPDTRKNIKVEGVGAYVSPLASVPLLAASVAAPLPHRPSERDRGIARR
jgi:hypothetical protein